MANESASARPRVDDSRRLSLAGDLARRGFADTARASASLGGLDEKGQDYRDRLVRAAGVTADPDLALAGLVDLDFTTRDAIVADQTWLARVAAVMGGSRALVRHLVTHNDARGVIEALHDDALAPHDATQLTTDIWASVGACPSPMLPDPTGAAADALRRANRDQLVRIAARDLTADDPAAALPGVAAELADLADAVVNVALAMARAEVPEQEHVRLGVVALGKCGARELNYISDVDVLFVVEPADATTSPTEAVRIGSDIAAALARLTSTATSAGSIWALDAALRPEGNAGPLVRTLDAMATYYRRHAATWEFQAMMKARPMAGDIALGKAFCDLVLPLVWGAGGTDGFIAASRAMRRRVVALIPSGQADREIKLGAGGLRDIEFTAQILQLVHGRADEALRQPGTLDALATLSQHGYMGREDAAAMDAAYRFERLLEHRQQLYRLRRTHLMPDDAAELRRLARSMPGVESGAALWAKWRQTAASVQRLQQRVYYSPLLEAVSKVPSGALRLSSAAAGERLAALGFADPAGALRHIGALTQGVSRAAEITRHIMPAMLGWLADGANPDAGLLAFRQVSEALGRSPWYLKALRDESGTAERLARVMASSRLCVDLLRRDPPSVGLLRGTELTPREPDDLRATFTATVRRHDDVAAAVQALRAARRHELVRLAVAVVLGRLDIEATGVALSDVTAATLDAALALAARVFPGAPPLGVVAMGRWGGRELSFASDADVMVVAPDDATGAQLGAGAEAVAALRGWLTQPGPDPGLEIDVRLRPEGQDGPLVRTVGAYLAYYRRWSWTWEAQS
ncbi:MAG: bifunctional [glutamine synthetase] adenylyltransferase/[glutamine synthetase]-adenylyl-L-tyrosine phosphorylase, partial [Propionibacteriaceae bacterium]|nr:bifunctional [glutamine synthetase] adenylyltransferase/[glutamine synthetase]-adenylyl-L-tyrosine phosphorylase [Propionibacteriaceae bacterium]